MTKLSSRKLALLIFAISAEVGILALSAYQGADKELVKLVASLVGILTLAGLGVQGWIDLLRTKNGGGEA